MYSLRTVWEAAGESEKDLPLYIGDPSASYLGIAPVLCQVTLNDYVDGKKTHPSVLVLSDLAPEEVK